MIQKDCPVDFIHVNENKVRLTALLVLVLLILSLFIATTIIFAFLSIDFFLRAFGDAKKSPINNLSNILVKKLNLSNKPIDQAPKKFAAGIGFVLSIAILLLHLISFNNSVFILTLVFASFAFLESFLRFCAGCYVYTFLIRLKLIK